MVNDKQDSFDILLIEDNEGDAVLIEKYLESIDDDLLPQPPSLGHEPDLSSGFDTLERRGADLLLLDLGLPGSSGLETLHRVLERNDEVPVVVLTGLDDDETAIAAVEEGAQDYLKKDRIDADGLGRALRYATERKAREKEAERQKRLNRMVQEVLVRSSTREEIEGGFCDRLVDHSPYAFAWIGDPGGEGGMMSSVSSSWKEDDGGGHGYLEAVKEAVAEGGSEDAEPSVRAASSHEPVSVQDTKEAEGPWTGPALEHGFGSVLSVPLRYNEVSYGVLSVYSKTKNAFTKTEREVLSSIAETLAYSLNAVSKETALSSGDGTEVVVGLSDAETYLTETFEALEENRQEGFGDTGADGGLRMVVRGTVPTQDGFLQFVNVDGPSPEDVTEAASSQSMVEEVKSLYETDSGGSYRFRVSRMTPEAYLLNLGVVVRNTTVSSDGVELRVGVPSERGVREVVEDLESRFGSVNIRMYRDGNGEDIEDGFERTLSFDADRLTEKQRQALRAAYYSGYFEQPKANSAEEVSDSLGVSRSTFLQHLRSAQRKVFGDSFE
jgi:predicted DNA binding protein/DNA-binding NarL/FixJ family response regulator